MRALCSLAFRGAILMRMLTFVLCCFFIVAAGCSISERCVLIIGAQHCPRRTLVRLPGAAAEQRRRLKATLTSTNRG